MSFDVVACAAETHTAEAFELAVLNHIDRDIGADVAFLANGYRSGPPTCLRLDRATFQGRRVAAYVRDLEPVQRAALASRGVAVDVDVLGTTSVRRTSYYRDLAAPMGGGQSLMAYLRLRGRVMGGLMMGRCRSSFRENDVRKVETLLPALTVACASYARPYSNDHVGTLSPREQEVLEYLCLGYRNREIAEACGTSVNTVRNQLASVFDKIGATTRSEAVAIARAS